MDITLLRYLTSSLVLEVVMFQSLFLWILHFYNYPIRYDADGTQSFNPCFNGYYTSTYDSASRRREVFQCFNPCFNGYYTSTEKRKATKQLALEFQSLF